MITDKFQENTRIKLETDLLFQPQNTSYWTIIFCIRFSARVVIWISRKHITAHWLFSPKEKILNYFSILYEAIIIYKGQGFGQLSNDNQLVEIVLSDSNYSNPGGRGCSWYCRSTLRRSQPQMFSLIKLKLNFGVWQKNDWFCKVSLYWSLFVLEMFYKTGFLFFVWRFPLFCSTILNYSLLDISNQLCAVWYFSVRTVRNYCKKLENS